MSQMLLFVTVKTKPPPKSNLTGESKKRFNSSEQKILTF